ncbi:MAG: phosphatidylcholine/phosphatidylserine synthase [Hyphomicrobiaceae bacterium]
MVKLAGMAVHVLTGLGAVCALLAVEAVMTGAWPRVFLWLGIAFLIDGIDGPIARAVEVKRTLPRFSGERIDLVIDYLTYVFVPVLVLLAAGRLPETLGHGLAGIILLSSLFHFCDVESKSRDLAFVGFPAIWNILAFYIFALDIGPWVSVALILACAVATFFPLHWVHPTRVTTLRPLTLALTALWSIAALLTVLQDFPAAAWAQLVFVFVALYGLALSAWLSLKAQAAAD